MATTDTGLVYNTSVLNAVTITSSYGNTLKSTDYPANVVTIDASARTKAINITGNDKNNVIIGGAGNDTINGAAGNDTVRGGDGKDVFIYSSGNDVITDYTAGSDTIRLADGTISSYGISGIDVNLKVGLGSVKILGRKSDVITIVDANKDVIYFQNGLIYNNSNTAKATALTVTSAYSTNTLGADDYGSAVVTVDATVRSKALGIIGNTKNNKIYGTIGNDTINGGAGNDTLTGGAGKDVFIYTTGEGTDVITDYAEGDDTIKLSDGTVTSYTTSGSDLTLKIGSKDASGSVKISGGKTSAVTIIDSKNQSVTYQNGLLYNNLVAKATVVTVSASASNTLSVDDYGVAVTTIDASARTKVTRIEGNDKNNSILGGTGKDTIYGGKGNDTIIGGKGNDSLFGGDGNDIFIYSTGDGNDVIADYTAAQDTIRITDATVSGYSTTGNDLVLKIGTGSIKVTGGKENAVTVVDSKNLSLTYQDGLIYNNVVSKATIVTVSSSYGNTLAADDYGTSVVTIDASPHSKAMNIAGNSKNNSILGTTGNDTIGGGTGNDTLTGNGGKNIFVYTAGNDVITDYIAGSDTLQIDSGSVSSIGITGSDVTLKIGSGSVKILNAKADEISIVDASSNVQVYESGLVYDVSDTSEAEAVTISAGYDGEYNASGTNIVTIDATARTTAVMATGNENNNRIYGTNGNDTFAGAAGNDYISSGAGNDSLSGGTGNDTLFGGKGDDTYTGGRGNDLFVYTNGDGNDVITDYTAGEDVISVSGAAVTSYSIQGSDVVFKIGSGNVTVKNGVDTRIRIVGATGAPSSCFEISNDDSLNEEVVEVLTFNDDATAVTINSGFSGTFSGTAYSSLISIDASARGAINIVGNANANYIAGSSGNDTISLGGGNDTYFYAGGDDYDVIRDYTEGADKIYIGENSVAGGVLNGNSVIFSIGDGVLKLNNARDKKVTIVSSSGETEYVNGSVPVEVTTPSGLDFNEKNTAVTINSYYPNNSDTFNATLYSALVSVQASTSGVNILGNRLANEILNLSSNSSISIDGGTGNDLINNEAMFVTIQGSAGKDSINNEGSRVWIDGGAGNDEIYNDGFRVSIEGGDGNDAIDNSGSYASLSGGSGNDTLMNYGYSVKIEGGAGNDKIFNSSSNATIIGGAGSDVITLGAHSHNVIQYSPGDGNDTIIGYNPNDSIQYSLNTFTTQASGNNTVVRFGSNTITLKDYSGDVTVVRAGSNSAKNSSALWFTEDDTNFVKDSSDLSSITDSGGSLTDFKFDTTPFENIFAQDSTLAYGAAEKT